jgi:Domain of unknown function (DUF4382)
MKNFKKPVAILASIFFVMVIFFSACQKEVNENQNTGGPKKVSIYLTDDPCFYDSVFIDIKYVEVKIDTNRAHMHDDHHGDDDDDGDDDNHHHDSYGRWDTLTIRAGVYNIAQLRNGIDTLLASGNLPTSTIRKIRITLGTNNRIVKNGVSYPLNLMQGSNKYVYIKINKDCEDDDIISQTSIWLDFDICESIKVRNGAYFLKPFFKVFSIKKYGRIEGKVFPRAASPFVKIFNATDSATALPENDGKYKIRGLRPGTYKIKFTGFNGYFDTTISNIQVQRNRETEINNITLRN